MIPETRHRVDRLPEVGGRSIRVEEPAHLALGRASLRRRNPIESVEPAVAMRPSRQAQRALAYMDRHEAGSRVQRYDRQMRAYAKSHGMDLVCTIVDKDGSGANQLFDLLDRDGRDIVLIPSRDHLQYLSFREIAQQASDVIEVCGP